MNLFLHEQVLLLLVSDEDGLLEFPVRLTGPMALAGATIVDLIRLQRVVESAGQLEPVSSDSTGNKAMDAVLQVIMDREKARRVETAARTLNAHCTQLALAGQRLVERGILDFEQKTLLWVFRKTRYPERDGAPERELRSAMGRALAGGEASEDVCACIGIVDAIQLLPLLAEQEGWTIDASRVRSLAAQTPLTRLATAIVADGIARTRTRPGPQI